MIRGLKILALLTLVLIGVAHLVFAVCGYFELDPLASGAVIGWSVGVMVGPLYDLFDRVFAGRVA